MTENQLKKANRILNEIKEAKITLDIIKNAKHIFFENDKNKNVKFDIATVCSVDVSARLALNLLLEAMVSMYEKRIEENESEFNNL